MTWLAVQTKPRGEIEALQNLERQGFSVFLPRVRQRKRRPGGWQWLVGPLFPRYLFIDVVLGEADLGVIRSTRGVVDLVRFGAALIPVENRVIEFLQRGQSQDDGAAVEDDSPYRHGERVEILRGPFAGLSGIFQVQREKDRVELLLDLLGRQSPVLVKRNDLGYSL
ncbi:transcription/translation regulatory transformer protein RfaH [Parahaliea maris]|uniref:Transcription/translation regulatory transformer protein RfaH n=1 Tax=Parahaliea maris TaxID=2716870 RepID=A0A5C8ZST2_9GAMM|nr:transcription termination/antitermination NusG family protein [Parahaliea maris]TXS90844.1 transcription/translation regulatory transformer protein RfaH [Parahaliea maris]